METHMSTISGTLFTHHHINATIPITSLIKPNTTTTTTTTTTTRLAPPISAAFIISSSQSTVTTTTSAHSNSSSASSSSSSSSSPPLHIHGHYTLPPYHIHDDEEEEKTTTIPHHHDHPFTYHHDLHMETSGTHHNHHHEPVARESSYCVVEDDDLASQAHDKASMSSFLHQVPLHEATEISKLCALSNLAYAIPQIKPDQLLKDHARSFVTSSFVKKEIRQASMSNRKITNPGSSNDQKGTKRARGGGNEVSASNAMTFRKQAAVDSLDQEVLMKNSTTAKSRLATEQESSSQSKDQEIKDGDIKLTCCPCEWFICDDEDRKIRYLVIQGSESLASWQTNLAFEPTKFEGLDDVWVHRGIYEAANGLYEEVMGDLHEMGQGWRLCFTGHSLGGSLGMLVALMAIRRGTLQANMMEGVVSFGAPYVLCGGEHLLEDLCMCTSQILNVILPRDIVPRAFSCNYPNHVAHILKHVNGTFRHHPCLNSQMLLYTPLGEMLILQPSGDGGEHELLPKGGVAQLHKIRHPSKCQSNDKVHDVVERMEVVRAQRAFLNVPHPLEMMMKYPRAIAQDHDPRTYAKAMNMVLASHQLVSLDFTLPTYFPYQQVFIDHNHDLNPQPSTPHNLFGYIYSLFINLLSNFPIEKTIPQNYSKDFVSEHVQIGIILILTMTIRLVSSLLTLA